MSGGWRRLKVVFKGTERGQSSPTELRILHCLRGGGGESSGKIFLYE